MFRLFRKKNDVQINGDTCLFCEDGTIDVTNFDVTNPNEPMGYLAACKVCIFQSGLIEIRSVDDEQRIMESTYVMNILRANNNINNFDPSYLTSVSLLTNNKEYRISFKTKELKNTFWSSLTAVYDKNK